MCACVLADLSLRTKAEENVVRLYKQFHILRTSGLCLVTSIEEEK